MTGEINEANIPWYLAKISVPVAAGVIGFVAFLSASLIFDQAQGLAKDRAAANESAKIAYQMELAVQQMKLQNDISNYLK